MKDTDLFQVALNLSAPWFVARSEFDADGKRLDLYLDFRRGGRFSCPVCGRADCAAYDSEEKTWRHLNFFQHQTYLHARTPRVNCAQCGVKIVSVPWARSDSGFTLLFEAFILLLASQMPVQGIARLVEEHDTRLWRLLHYYVEEARNQQDYAEVTDIGIDETSSKRGHNYITLFVDMEEPKVLFATPGKDADTLKAFEADLKNHGGKPEQIQEACCDMSPAFILGIEQVFEEADITFDRFHVMKVVNTAVDEVRREEQKDHAELKNSRYVWLKNPENLTIKQQGLLDALTVKKLNLKTARAYQIKLNFQELYNQPKALSESFLQKWFFWATHSRLQPIIDAAYTIKNHWQGVLRWFDTRISNGILEGINSLIQAAKAKARGYRSTRNLITMVYLIAGKLDLRLPT